MNATCDLSELERILGKYCDSTECADCKNHKIEMIEKRKNSYFKANLAVNLRSMICSAHKKTEKGKKLEDLENLIRHREITEVLIDELVTIMSLSLIIEKELDLDIIGDENISKDILNTLRKKIPEAVKKL